MSGIKYNSNVQNQKGTPALYSDIFAKRPTASLKGRLFFSTDTQQIFEDTGSAWNLLAGISSTSVGTLQQVLTAGNTANLDISLFPAGQQYNAV